MSVVTATILSDGNTKMDPTYELLSIDINKEVNRIPHAQLTLIDEDAAQRTFKISSTPFFEPGKEIEIKLRYEGEPSSEKTVFKGLVIKHSIESDERVLLFTVELKDAAIKLTQIRKSQVFRKQTDDKIIAKITQRVGWAEPAKPNLFGVGCNAMSGNATLLPDLRAHECLLNSHAARLQDGKPAD